MVYEDLGFIDFEETMAFLARYEGDIRFADGEVTESKWVPRTQLVEFVSECATTPWMRRDLNALGWL